MAKVRIIPCLLTDGLTLVKGSRFDNWRSVGTIQTAAQIFSKRRVDELILLDVNASRDARHIDLEYIKEFSKLLSTPFAVGGGIDSLEVASKCLHYGAEKVVIGAALRDSFDLVVELRKVLGSQAVIGAVNVVSTDPLKLWFAGKIIHFEFTFEEYLAQLEDAGVGEILLQSVAKDGEMAGMDYELIAKACAKTNVPIIASSGAANPVDILKAIQLGASAVAAGAMFQFTQTTPASVRNFLRSNGVLVRNE